MTKNIHIFVGCRRGKAMAHSRSTPRAASLTKCKRGGPASFSADAGLSIEKDYFIQQYSKSYMLFIDAKLP